MKSIKTTLFVGAFALVCSCCGCDYEQYDNSVKIVGEQITTEITVVDSDIIHVRKYLSSSTTYSPIKDYTTVIEPQDVEWSVKQKGGNIAIITSDITATVDRNGEISYTTNDGAELVSELSDESVIEENSLISQSFSVGDEALYGLGQYQNGLMNWRNTPLRLQQYNQELAIPFMVSTAGYGIYWNNMSVTDFNLPTNEIAFDEVIDTKRKIKRGRFTPKKSGTHYFIVDSKTPETKKNRRLGAVNLLLDKDTVISYTTMWFPDAFSGCAELEAGREYEVIYQDEEAQVEGRVLYNDPDYNKTKFSNVRGKAVDYYFISGKNPQQIVSAYSRLTGSAPLLPKSALGFWQCREAYHTQAELLENATEYRKRKIPVDNIVQDWDYWPNGTRGPEWDRTRYPNPRQMLKNLKAMNLNLLVSVWPAVNNRGVTERYGLKMMGETYYIDAYDPTIANSYYRALSDSMYKIGVQAIWTDGNEPIIEPAPEAMTAMGEFQDVANGYSFFVSKALYEGHRAEFPESRVINLSRSAYSGQQRFSTMVWSGDVDGTWEALQEQVTAGLNTTIAGIPYWTTDIGGFFRNKTNSNTIERDQYNDPEYRELLSRWFTYGTFCPIFRIHGFQSQTEVWRYGAEFEALARKYINLRYQLMPYIYSTAKRVTDDGFVMMSPMAYLFPEERALWGSKDQFMFGESMMICPVLEYKQRSREVYLPKGVWYNFWNGEKLQGGGSITVDAELDEIPIYVRGGSIIPIGAEIQHTAERSDKPITLRIYPGADGEFTLYYDDASSYKYENGEYSTIKVSYYDESGNIEIVSNHDKFSKFADNPAQFVVDIVGKGVTKEVTFDGKAINNVSSK